MSSSYLRSPESLAVPLGASSSLDEINGLATSDPLAAAEEEKKKKQAQAKAEQPQAEKQVAKQKQDLVKQGTNAVAEVGTAVAGGVTDAWNDTGGRIPWLHIDNKSLENKTWYGGLIRSLAEFTTLAVVTRRAAGAASKIPIGAIAKPARFLSSEGTTLGGKLGRNVAQGAVIGNLSTHAEDKENISNALNGLLGFNISPLAIDEADSPMMKRLKNTLEGAGFDSVFSRVEAAIKGGKAGSRAIEASDNTRLTQEFIRNGELGTTARTLQEQADKAKAAWQGARDEATIFKAQLDANPKDPAIKAQYDALIKKRDELATANGVAGAQARQAAAAAKAKPEAVATEAYNNSIKQSEKNAARVEADNAVHAYTQDPDFKNGPNPDASNPALFDPHERASIKPDTTPAVALRNAVQTLVDPVQRDGRVGSVMTESNFAKVTGSNDSIKRVVTQMMSRLDKDPALETLINGQRFSRKEMIDRISTQLYDQLEGVDGLDADELEALLRQNQSSYQPVSGGKRVEYMSPENQALTQVLIKSTAGELADLANVQRSIAGAVDTARQDDMILKRLEVLMRLNKEASYAVGKQLADRKPNYARIFMPDAGTEAEAALKIKEEVGSVINTIRQVADSGDRRLLQTFIDAASISDGSVRTMTDLSAYMKKRIGFNGWIYGSPAEQGMLLKGLTSTFFNSVLSGPRTFTKAVFQTTIATMLRPANLFVGGMLKLDGRLVAKSLHQMGAGFEGIGEALSMANMSKKAWLAGEQGPYQRAFGERGLPFHETDEFKALDTWAQVEGTIGDRYAVKLGKMLSMHNNHWSGNYSMGIMDMGDTFTRTLLGRIELKNRAFDEAWQETGGKVTTDLLKSYETKFRDLIFDKEGVVTDLAARMAGDEVTLTTPLKGIAEQAETLMNSVPLIRPFMMFPRTANNAIQFVSSYTPGLNMMLKEINEVMTCSLEDAPAIMQKYGISDLEAARAAHNGRVATGMMLVGAAGSLYLTGGLTGNGTMDKEEMKLKRGLGWQPRSIRIGDKWVSYDGIEPFASILSMVCDIGDVSDPMNQEDAFAKLGFLIGANLTNKSFLSGIGPLSELLTGKVNKSFTNITANTLNSLVPYGGLRNWTANVWQPQQREVEDDIRQKIMNRNPKLGFLPGKTDLPLERDVLSGKPIFNENDLMRLFNASMPFAVNPAWNQTREILFKSGFEYRTAFNNGPQGEELTPQQRSTLTQYAADYKIEDRLTALFSTKEYKASFDLYQKVLSHRGLAESFPPAATNHIWAIKQIFDDAKGQAYTRMKNETGENQAVLKARTTGLLKNAANRGDLNMQEFYVNQLLNLSK